MPEMNPCQRVMAALRRQQPDRIPHFEWIIDHRVRQAIIGSPCTIEEFTVRMGLDAILTAPDFQKQPAGPNRSRSEWGVVYEKTAEEVAVAVEGPIASLEDLRKYQPPDPCAKGRYASLERLVERYKGKLAIGVHVNDVMSVPRNLMGYENWLMTLAAEPDLVRALVEMSVEVNLAMIKEVARRGADFVFTGDDYASTESPLMSPAVFRELLLPGLTRIVSGAHDAGLPIIKHTDGNIVPLLDMIVGAGIDCLDPIDPVAGLDIGEIKRKYGHRIALKGNVNCAHTLTFGSEADVVRETRDAIRKAGDGGGLILSSSNSIHSAVKPGNYLAMWNAIRMFGRYPLALDGWSDVGAREAF